MLARIFRSYDIRGIYGEDITENVFDKIGNAFTQVTVKDVCIARDARLSSEKLLNAFMNGALRAERTVMNIGQLPIGCAVHWANSQNFELAYVTASHMPKDWNGIKFFHADGTAFMEDEGQQIKELVESDKYFTGLRGVPVREEIDDVINLYINHLTSKIKADTKEKKKLKILIDCGNGATGIIVKKLFREAGFDADVIFEEPDGNFPNRSPDPHDDPLNEMRKKVVKYDFGIAFDGDGDRIVIVDKSGSKLKAEQAAFVVLKELFKTQNGGIVANVECSKLIDEIASTYGSKVVRVRVGHTFMLDAVAKNSGIAFALERAGHYVIPYISQFDDAVAFGLYFTYAVHKSGSSLEDLLKELKTYPIERLDFKCSDETKFRVLENITAVLSSQHDNVDRMDGIRVNTDVGWALIRVSNTGPVIRMTVEADSEKNLNEMKNKFSKIVEEEIKRI